MSCFNKPYYLKDVAICENEYGIDVVQFSDSNLPPFSPLTLRVFYRDSFFDIQEDANTFFLVKNINKNYEYKARLMKNGEFIDIIIAGIVYDCVIFKFVQKVNNC